MQRPCTRRNSERRRPFSAEGVIYKLTKNVFLEQAIGMQFPPGKTSELGIQDNHGAFEEGPARVCPVSKAFAFFKKCRIEEILSEHSKSVYGEDYETSLRLHASGGRVYYDGRLTVKTTQRRSLWDLTRQRMGWDLSLLKIHWQLMGKLRSARPGASFTSISISSMARSIVSSFIP
jgi:cellulose synthase/poly-beta-1,6-N-acetylglucosamine synthase-like glycosyltransferase